MTLISSRARRERFLKRQDSLPAARAEALISEPLNIWVAHDLALRCSKERGEGAEKMARDVIHEIAIAARVNAFR